MANQVTHWLVLVQGRPKFQVLELITLVEVLRNIILQLQDYLCGLIYSSALQSDY